MKRIIVLHDNIYGPGTDGEAVRLEQGDEANWPDDLVKFVLDGDKKAGRKPRIKVLGGKK